MAKKQITVDFIDIHYHADPDFYLRRYNAIAAGKIYRNLQGAVVLKSHLGSTAVTATLCQSEGLPVYSSLVLNKIAGGIDYRVVMRTLSERSASNDLLLLVHLPTIVKTTHTSKLKRKYANEFIADYANEVEPVTIDGKSLRPEVIDILKMSNDFPIVISTGHANQHELELIIEACDKLGIKKLLLNQPASPITGLKLKQLQAMSNMYHFIWTEQTSLTYLLGYQEWDDFMSVLTSLPRVIYSSDLGQIEQLDINEWLSISKEWFNKMKISQTKIREIMLDNPLKLLQE